MSPRSDPRGSIRAVAPAPGPAEMAPHECRCGCGSLLARLRPDGVELKCRRCKRVITLTFTEIFAGEVGAPVRSADARAGHSIPQRPAAHEPRARATVPRDREAEMRRAWLLAILMVGLIGVTPAQAGSDDALLKLLIRKGILTQEDVDALKREMAAEEAAQKAAPPAAPAARRAGHDRRARRAGGSRSGARHRGPAERSRRAGPQRDPDGDGREGRGGDLDLGHPRG